MEYKAPKVGVMLDIETLATETRPVVIQIAMASWALDDPSTIVRSLKHFLPVDPQLQLIPSRKINASTIGFWLRQGDSSRLAIASELEGDFDDLAALLRAVARGFNQMTVGLKDHEYEVWARGPQFDVNAIESLMTECGVVVPWEYSQVRDLRTLMAAAGIGTDDVPKFEGFIAHRAEHDVRYQIDCHAAAMHKLGSQG